MFEPTKAHSLACLAKARPDHGDVAQLGELRLCKADVRGSSPLISTWAGSAGWRLEHS